MKRLRKIHIHILTDKASGRLASWRGRNLTRVGRVCLVKTVLTSQPVFALIVLIPPVETLEELDRIRKRFLWAGDSTLIGEKCKVNWTRSCLPKENRALGVVNLCRFARALLILWHEWVSPDKTWVGTEMSCDNTDHLLFAACTTNEVGNEDKTNFWHSGCIQGRRPKGIALALFA